MDSEIASLKVNNTWTLTSKPPEANVIPCKWVFRVKTNPDGSIIDKYKARLVVKGFSQRAGVDYKQNFSPVAKMGTIRSIPVIAASEKMSLTQFDVSTAFLYGDLDEKIYIRQPEGYGDGSNKVCLLQKNLYGLKQAPRCWNKRFGNFLSRLRFRKSEADPCLFIRESNGLKLILVLYVDDGLIAASDKEDLKKFLQDLQAEFKITSKDASYFLGVEIKQTEKGVKISQEAYAKKILQPFGMEDCKPVSTPIVKKGSTPRDDTVNKAKEPQMEVNGRKIPYREAIGTLMMYLMLGSRPDLALCIGMLSRSLESASY